MALEQQYRRAHLKLMEDASICPENRRLFKEFFEFQEYKLKRQNGLPSLDDGCHKTLVAYIARLRTVNRWFENKPWKCLTKADIQRVYDSLEDGKLKTLSGRPWKDKASYYNKVLRGKPFELAGKADLVREVMAFGTRAVQSEVRFITEETFRRIVETVIQPLHRALLWLCFDIGENASSLLVLRKRDCVRQQNSETKEWEYRVNLAERR